MWPDGGARGTSLRFHLQLGNVSLQSQTQLHSARNSDVFLLLDQSPVGCEVRDPYGCSLTEVQSIRQFVDGFVSSYSEFCVRSGLCGRGENPISCLETHRVKGCREQVHCHPQLYFV